MKTSHRVGLGVLGGAFVAANAFGASPEAVAETGGVCDPVYDQTSSGSVFPGLQKEIDTYAAEGIVVRALIFKEAPGGATSKADLVAQQQKIAEQCGYAGKGYVSIAISQTPRLYNIRKSGPADKTIPTSSIDGANAQFVKDLQDTSTPYQSDIAGLLTTIDPVKKPKPSAAPSTAQTTSSITPEAPAPNIPILPLLYVFGGVVVVGLGTTRGLRHYQIMKTYKEADGELQEVVLKGNTIVGSTEEILLGINEDDAAELRDNLKGYQQSNGAISEHRGEAKHRIHQEALRIWPDIEVARGIARSLITFAAEATISQASLAEQFTQYKDKIDVVDTLIKQAQGQLDEIQPALNTLAFGGWDMGDFSSLRDGLSSTLATATERRQSGHIGKAEDGLEACTDSIGTLYAEIVGLEDARKTTDDAISKQAFQIIDAGKDASIAEARFADFAARYDVSCYRDLQPSVKGLEQALQALTPINDDANAEFGQKSYASVKRAKGLVKDFDDALQEVTTIISRVADRAEELAKIERELPQSVVDMSRRLAELDDYVDQQYPNDIDDETRRNVKQATKNIATLNDGLAAATPKYLGLADKSQELIEYVQELTDTAQNEKADTDALREQYQEDIAAAVNDYEELQAYVESHGSTTLRDISIPTYKEKMTRKELLAAAKRLETARDYIKTARAKAKLRAEVARVRSSRARSERYDGYGSDSVIVVSNYGHDQRDNDRPHHSRRSSSTDDWQPSNSDPYTTSTDVGGSYNPPSPSPDPTPSSTDYGGGYDSGSSPSTDVGGGF